MYTHAVYYTLSSQTSIVLVIGFSTFLSVVLVIVLSTSLPAYLSTLSLHISFHPSFLFPHLSVHLSHLDSFPSLFLSPSLLKIETSKNQRNQRNQSKKIYGKSLW